MGFEQFLFLPPPAWYRARSLPASLWESSQSWSAESKQTLDYQPGDMLPTFMLIECYCEKLYVTTPILTH